MHTIRFHLKGVIFVDELWSLILSGVQPWGQLGRCDNQQMDRIPLRFDGEVTSCLLEKNHDLQIDRTGQVCHEPVRALPSPPIHRQINDTHISFPVSLLLPFSSTFITLTFKSPPPLFLSIPVLLSPSPSLWSFLLSCEDWEEYIPGKWENILGSWEGVMAGCLSRSQGWGDWHIEKGM